MTVSLRVLLTNSELEAYAGSGLTVRDLALELSRQGHTPIVYSPKSGLLAKEISSYGIQVTSDPANLAMAPDVIHGQQHPQLVQALLQFPDTPGLLVCNGSQGHLCEPVVLPRILRYVAVDNRCRNFLASHSEIPRSRIEVIENAVDLDRFQNRSPLPMNPKRALVFSNYASRRTHLSAVRIACRRMRLQLDVVGIGSGNPATHPEEVLPRYDLVFAKARCALEAMAVGNAVVLCDFMGAGPLVTTANFDQLRLMNFGMAVLQNPLRYEYLIPEISRYDAVEAAAVSLRVRNEAGLAAATRRWIQVYEAVVAEFKSSVYDYAAELRAFAAYFSKWNYEKRVDWEWQQIEKLQNITLIGHPLAAVARRAMFWLKGR